MPVPAPIRRQPAYWRTLTRALPPLLAVDVVAAAVLLPPAVQALRLQSSLPLGARSDFNALVTKAEHLVLLALAGLLASTRRPGWRLLAIGLATTNASLGIVSPLPHQPSSWGLPGAVASLLAAAAFATATTVAATHPDRDYRPGLARIDYGPSLGRGEHWQHVPLRTSGHPGEVRG